MEIKKGVNRSRPQKRKASAGGTTVSTYSLLVMSGVSEAPCAGDALGAIGEVDVLDPDPHMPRWPVLGHLVRETAERKACPEYVNDFLLFHFAPPGWGPFF